MLLENGNALHLVLFGTTSEGRYFLREFRDKFDLIGFNANMIAYTPEFMASFISQLRNKTFFIDPQTYAFQQPTKSLMKKKDGVPVPKKSLVKLANIYGSKIQENFGNESLDPAELSSNEIEEISRNVLNFQKTFVQSNISEETKEFLDNPIIEPTFLIAPYFYLEADNFEKVIESNLTFIAESLKFLSVSDKLFAEIAISKEVLNDEKFCTKLENSYINSQAQGFVLWIDDFSELKASEFLLNRYKNFIAKLSSTNKPILMLHGSYLSIVLSSKHFKYLAAVGHGIEYGESRALVPVGGGVPTAKFYFPKYHQRIDYDSDAQNILIKMKWTNSQTMYNKSVCNCEVCNKLITDDSVDKHFMKYGETKISDKNGKAYPTGEALDLSRRHYLSNKILEYSLVNSNSLNNIIEDISSAEIESNSFKIVFPVTHLSKWKNILKGTSESIT